MLSHVQKVGGHAYGAKRVARHFLFFRATILLRFAATAANVEFHSRFTNRATIVVKKKSSEEGRT